jgi:hypothetical protein
MWRTFLEQSEQKQGALEKIITSVLQDGVCLYQNLAN